jgi:perosamine synthetase
MQKDNQFSKVLKIDAEHYAPCATRTIPYGRQWIDEDDIQAVVEVLRSDWLTTGPKVAEFEQAFAGFAEAKEAVAVNSGTAALHAAMYAVGIGPGDEVILPPMTFVATANAVVFQGGTPVFADVDPDTLLIDPNQVEDKITQNTKAIVAVDYAGHPCDYDALKTVAAKHDLFLVADACHSLGAEYKGRKVGTLADLTVFSFHPVKHITTGEGGMVVTNNTEFAEKMRRFRNHGINTDHRKRADQGTWYYEMEDLGYNYRITDIQCALGLSQLQKLPKFLERRCEIAALYDEALADIPGIEHLGLRADVFPAAQSAKRMARGAWRKADGAKRRSPCALRSLHSYHLYVVKIDLDGLKIGRNRLFSNFRSEGIGVNVHYIPVHLHPFYMKRFHTKPGLCPVAEEAYEQILSLPMFPGITDEGIERVIKSITESINQKSESCWEKWEKHIELR